MNVGHGHGQAQPNLRRAGPLVPSVGYPLALLSCAIGPQAPAGCEHPCCSQPERPHTDSRPQSHARSLPAPSRPHASVSTDGCFQHDGASPDSCSPHACYTKLALVRCRRAHKHSRTQQLACQARTRLESTLGAARGESNARLLARSGRRALGVLGEKVAGGAGDSTATQAREVNGNLLPRSMKNKCDLQVFAAVRNSLARGRRQGARA